MIRSIHTKQGRGWGVVVLAVALAAAAVPLVCASGIAAERAAFPVTVTVGQSLVLEMPREVSTVSIAEPKIADAAVASERTVVVNGKSPGITSLVVWEEGRKYTLYEVTCLDTRRHEQVLLHARIAELNKTKASELGLDWLADWTSDKALKGALSGGLFVTKVESPHKPLLLGPTTDGFVTYDRSAGDFSFMSTFRALEQSGVVRTLATPDLVALSGDSASFLVGGEFPVPITRAVGEGSVSYSVEWKEYGVRLGFVPTVLDSGRIRLRVVPEVSAPDYTVAVTIGSSQYPIPGVVARRVQTTVEMKSGEVLIIGGLKYTEKNTVVKKFPILGDIPIVNLLFRHKKTEEIDRELLIAVSPEIMGTLGRTFPAAPGEEQPEEGN